MACQSFLLSWVLRGARTSTIEPVQRWAISTLK